MRGAGALSEDVSVSTAFIVHLAVASPEVARRRDGLRLDWTISMGNEPLWVVEGRKGRELGGQTLAYSKPRGWGAGLAGPYCLPPRRLWPPTAYSGVPFGDSSS